MHSFRPRKSADHEVLKLCDGVRVWSFSPKTRRSTWARRFVSGWSMLAAAIRRQQYEGSVPPFAHDIFTLRSFQHRGSAMRKRITIAMKRENVRTGRLGGYARARSLTKKRRREIAIAASKVAAAKRTAAAEARSVKGRS
jgi:hypothetical protein